MTDGPIHVDIPEAGTVDVSAVMDQIRARITAKEKAGFCTEDSVRDAAESLIMRYAEEANIDSLLLDHLRVPGQAWNINTNYHISSHRPGKKGKLIVMAKKLVRPFVRLYTDYLTNRQAQLNIFYHYMIHHLVRANIALKIDLEAMQRKLEALQTAPAGARDEKGATKEQL